MIAKIDYRKILMKTVCQKCNYFGECGLPEDYDCEALERLVKIYEDLDCDNPNM